MRKNKVKKLKLTPPKPSNGHVSAKRRMTVKARQRILNRVRSKGVITNEQARKIGRFNQVWYHLAQLEKAGFIKHDGHNNWVPVVKRGRVRPYV